MECTKKDCRHYAGTFKSKCFLMDDIMDCDDYYPLKTNKEPVAEVPCSVGLCAGPFTEEDLETCWPVYQTYLVEILNGEYPLEDAKEDLRGLIGSKYDPRTSA